MGGSINVSDAPHGAKVTTMGGNIQIKSAARFIQAKTMGGNIDVDEIDGWIKATTMGGNVNATMTGDPEKGERHRQAYRHEPDQDAEHEGECRGPLHGLDPVRQVMGCRIRPTCAQGSGDPAGELDGEQRRRHRDHGQQGPLRDDQFLVEQIAPGEGVEHDP